MDFEIRAATVDDAMALGAMHVAAWREAYFPHILSEASFEVVTPEARGARYVDLLTANMGTTWLAIADDEIIGHSTAVAAEPDAPGDLELVSIYVLAKAYGSGAGQALLDSAIGDRSACLWVAAENPRALSFYRRNGFEAVGEPVRRTFILDELDEVRMAR
ncbi:MAG TPA: GNAT family N-acetyltransferase [Galbitalea sp.]|nr:GNAT family N-acetyltransferase [Galbitalea sp.]